MNKKQPVTATGEDVDWDEVIRKHPKLIKALGCLGIVFWEEGREHELAVEKAVEQVMTDAPKPAANVAGVIVEPSTFTLRPSSTGREHFIEVVFPQNPGKAICAELSAAGFHYSRFNVCWYGQEDGLPARYRASHPGVWMPVVSKPSPTPAPAIVEVKAAAPKTSENVTVAEAMSALTVRRTLGGTMDRGYSVVHVASNKAIGSAYQNLEEAEANRLLTIVLPLADWTKPVSELLQVPGLQDKLARALCPTPAPAVVEPKPVPPVPQITVVPPPVAVPVVAVEPAKPVSGIAAKLRALCKKGS
jgi:hypothetical protein